MTTAARWVTGRRSGRDNRLLVLSPMRWAQGAVTQMRRVVKEGQEVVPLAQLRQALLVRVQTPQEAAATILATLEAVVGVSLMSGTPHQWNHRPLWRTDPSVLRP